MLCDRTRHCLNFRLRAKRPCDLCGEPITGHHFHDTAVGYRICHPCLEHTLTSVADGTFRPADEPAEEAPDCTNGEDCFASRPYGLFADKICDGCGLVHPPQHFHDTERNIRLCLPCYLERRDRYRVAASPGGRRPAGGTRP